MLQGIRKEERDLRQPYSQNTNPKPGRCCKACVRKKPPKHPKGRKREGRPLLGPAVPRRDRRGRQQGVYVNGDKCLNVSEACE